MKYTKMLGLCLVTAVALMAVLATTASAKLPEWGQCEPTESGAGGRYADAGCTLPVKKVYGKYTGGYEWYPLEEWSQPYSENTEKKHASTLGYSNGEGPQPVDEATITLASGAQIKCAGLVPETRIPFNGPHVSTMAPYFEWGNCEAAGGECHGTDAGIPNGIGSLTAYYKGIEEQEEEEYREGKWTGTMTFIEGKSTSTPSVGIVYVTEHPKERLMQQIVCEDGPIHAFIIGGRKGGEELTTQITPVNAMSESFTADLRQSGGVQLPATLEGHATKPLWALVNGAWETVGLEATMLFPEALPGFDSAHNHKNKYLELKATR